MRWFRLAAGPALVLASAVAAAALPCGTALMRERAARAPAPAARAAAVRQQAAAIAVGTRLDFYVSGSPVLLSATCRHLGTSAYLFVEDQQWDTNGGPIAQPDVDRLADLLERATPADPSRGLLALETEVFGPVPDVDGDPRVFVLILDIPESNIVGFFDPRAATYEIPELRRDTIYLELYDLGLGQRRDRRLVQGTLAHELQHLIHWGQDPDEERWIDEGLSGYAEEVAGFPEADPSSVPSFLDHPDLSLTEWPLWQDASDSTSVRARYGATYLFVSFLSERHGRPTIRRLVAEGRNGTAGVEAAVSAGGATRRFADIWGEWVVANAVAEAPHAYAALRSRRARWFAVGELPLDQAEGSVDGQWGSLNVLLRRPGYLAVEFAGPATARYRVWTYAYGPQADGLRELPLDAENRGVSEAPAVDSLLVITGRTSLADGSFLLSAREYIPTAVVAGAGSRPSRLALAPAYPNPFNGQVVVSFDLPTASPVSLEVYSAGGQRVRSLRQGWFEAGRHPVAWDGTDAAGATAASGVYSLVLRCGPQHLTRRVVLLR